MANTKPPTNALIVLAVLANVSNASTVLHPCKKRLNIRNGRGDNAVDVEKWLKVNLKNRLTGSYTPRMLPSTTSHYSESVDNPS